MGVVGHLKELKNKIKSIPQRGLWDIISPKKMYIPQGGLWDIISQKKKGTPQGGLWDVRNLKKYDIFEFFFKK